jgi:outer membrane protein OmpA-like peptidoglycan-associated protein
VAPPAPSRPPGPPPDRDRDGDGIVDRLDRCPTAPGPLLYAGCPPPDRDDDGVLDQDDRCPEVPGVPENDGCPDVDSDGDGIVDRLDHCPFDPEVFNGLADDDGCPDPGGPLAELKNDRIVTFEPIGFEGDAIARRSHLLLSVVAKLLELHREIRRLRIEGHTDDRGSAVDSLDRSRRRAAAVRRHLIDINGVDGRRLTAEGFGADRPIADNRGAFGRARNRRIEFVVVERGAPRPDPGPELEPEPEPQTQPEEDP